jgi:hypothetical protein
MKAEDFLKIKLGEDCIKNTPYYPTFHEEVKRWLNTFADMVIKERMPTEEEISAEAHELNQDKNPDTGQFIWKYAFDDDQAEAFITGAKWFRSHMEGGGKT